MTRSEAYAYRSKIEQAAAKLTDSEALTSAELFERWSGRAYTAGERVTDGGILYKARQDIAANPTWRPSLTPTLWEPVAPPTETGTVDNPITAVIGMTYVTGLYYKEDDKLYLCKRAGTPDGTEIMLYYLPSQLIGHYFEEVAAA
mgnify:CR=1 FL=1